VYGIIRSGKMSVYHGLRAHERCVWKGGKIEAH
jgi:hypothetical protein